MIKMLSNDLFDELVEIRRHLHRFPELGLFENKTFEFIANKLTEYNIPYLKSYNTGIIAYINKDTDKKILLRADIDALPINEETGLEFSSQNRGVMHACGHDFHIACLLGAAKILNNIKDSLNIGVVLVFQPDEEGEGGAQAMIADGALDNVCASVALHIEPLLETGNVYIRDGAIMASPDYFILNIEGKGGHGACPELCINPISAGSEIVQEFHKLSEKNEGIVSVCTFNSGTESPNIIPENAQITGTVRSLDEKTRTYLKKELKNICEKICKKYNALYKFDYHDLYPPLINDAYMNNIVKESCEILGIKTRYLEKSSMTGDDFSYFAQSVPSSYFKLGVGNALLGMYPLHNSKLNPDENALPIGSAILAQTVLNYSKGL